MELPFKNIITFQKNSELSDTYDVELNNIHELDRFHSLECHIVIYPYSRKISSRHMSLYPFSEYVKDILSHQRSAYAKIVSPMSKIFGMFMGIIITIIFFFLKRAELYSIESIVSIFGAYVIGKELWDDIENFLIHISRKWRLRYIENYYSYKLEKQTTLTHYSYLAKKERYGISSLMPDKMDYIEQSNSETIRMFFNINDLKSGHGPSAHVLSIHIDSNLLKDFEKRGYMLGVKISFNRKFLWIFRCYEFFQSISGNSHGCLDDDCKWVPEGIFYRKTVQLGRVKLFLNTGLIETDRMISG